MQKEFLTGNEAIVKGALACGAEMLTGYPITPTTEIIHYWAEAKINPPAGGPDLKFLQTEDEMSAGFAMIGGVLAGKKAFTATAGPGNVLMQDAFSMAESLRLPTVAFINQRGGPSTGTVIYSQQELNLTCFGGNGEGLRIVYSASSVQEMYDFAIKAFNTAWKYRFPTFVLSDGYSAKASMEIETYTPEEKDIEMIEPNAYLLGKKEKTDDSVNLRNCYNLETELNTVVENTKKAFDDYKAEIIEYEDYKTLDADVVIVAHGIVAAAAHLAVNRLREDGIKVGLFRPITLSPFPAKTAREILANKSKILVVESALGQLASLLKTNIYGLSVEMETLQKPAMGIDVEEIVNRVKEVM